MDINILLYCLLGLLGVSSQFPLFMLKEQMLKIENKKMTPNIYFKISLFILINTIIIYSIIFLLPESSLLWMIPIAIIDSFIMFLYTSKIKDKDDV